MMVSDVAPATEGVAATEGTDDILVMLVKEPLEAKKVQVWSLPQSFMFIYFKFLYKFKFSRSMMTKVVFGLFT